MIGNADSRDGRACFRTVALAPAPRGAAATQRSRPLHPESDAHGHQFAELPYWGLSRTRVAPSAIGRSEGAAAKGQAICRKG